MTAFPASPADQTTLARTVLGDDDLVAGPCALPEAPLAMPPQVIEPQRGLLRRLVDQFVPHRPAAGAGA